MVMFLNISSQGIPLGTEPPNPIVMHGSVKTRANFNGNAQQPKIDQIEFRRKRSGSLTAILKTRRVVFLDSLPATTTPSITTLLQFHYITDLEVAYDNGATNWRVKWEGGGNYLGEVFIYNLNGQQTDPAPPPIGWYLFKKFESRFVEGPTGGVTVFGQVYSVYSLPSQTDSISGCGAAFAANGSRAPSWPTSQPFQYVLSDRIVFTNQGPVFYICDGVRAYDGLTAAQNARFLVTGVPPNPFLPSCGGGHELRFASALAPFDGYYFTTGYLNEEALEEEGPEPPSVSLSFVPGSLALTCLRATPQVSFACCAYSNYLDFNVCQTRAPLEFDIGYDNDPFSVMPPFQISYNGDPSDGTATVTEQ